MTILSIEDVHKRFRRLEVLNGTSLAVERGEVVGLVGENGSGKTTLLQIIVRLLRRDRGEVYIDGRLGYCPQQLVLFDTLTMQENLSYFAAGYGLSPAELHGRSDELLNHLHCTDHASIRLANLSGGTKQKLNLIISLLHQPTLLVLDEPYQGFDYESYLSFWDLADELKQRSENALIVSHMLIHRERLDRVYSMQDGRAVLEGQT
jgi:ABC-type multidrug transport system ATPase subunit